MISNLVIEHAMNSEMDPLLQALFQYIDRLSLPEEPYVTGQPPISRKSLLKCFFLKIYFSIDSLRQLVDTLNRFGYFRRICGLKEVPYFSTFSRAGKWFRGLWSGDSSVSKDRIIGKMAVSFPQHD